MNNDHAITRLRDASEALRLAADHLESGEGRHVPAFHAVDVLTWAIEGMAHAALADIPFIDTQIRIMDALHGVIVEQNLGGGSNPARSGAHAAVYALLAKGLADKAMHLAYSTDRQNVESHRVDL